jgi:hypothetical protein
MRRLLGICAAALVAGASAVAGQASAAIIDIGVNNGVWFNAAPGWYQFEWVGTAQGGAYDGAYVGCASACANGWTEAFTAMDANAIAAFGNPAGNADFSVYTDGALFSSALAALNAYQTQPVSAINLAITNGVVSNGPPISVTTQLTPFTFYFDGTPSFLHVADPDKNSDNNSGGISLRIQAVPEPATWGLMIMGFALTGAMLRRRSKAVALRTAV